MDYSKLKIGSILYRLSIENNFSLRMNECSILKIEEGRIFLDEYDRYIYNSPYSSDSVSPHSSVIDNMKNPIYKILGSSCFYHYSKKKLVKYVLKKLKEFSKQRESTIRSLERHSIKCIRKKDLIEERLKNQEYHDIDKELKKGILYHIEPDLNIVLSDSIKVVNQNIEFMYGFKTTINKTTGQMNSHTFIDKSNNITYYTTRLEASRVLKIRNLDQRFLFCQNELEKSYNLLKIATLLNKKLSEYDLG